MSIIYIYIYMFYLLLLLFITMQHMGSVASVFCLFVFSFSFMCTTISSITYQYLVHYMSMYISDVLVPYFHSDLCDES